MRDRLGRLRTNGREDVQPTRRREPAPDHPLQRLQREVGNAAVVRMLGASPKLKVGAVADPAEAVADRVAADVMRRLHGASVSTTDSSSIHRAPAPAAAAAPGHGLEGGDALPATAAAIEAARGGGKSLDETTLSRMEGAFRADLSGVRVHTDGHAADLSRDLNAKAFTTGNDVFFGEGVFRPGTPAGDEVLAHELTHTVQQGGDARRISRLNVKNTNWEKATNARISSSGAVGVGIIDDGKKAVVVKPAESNAIGLLIAANLVDKSVGGRGKKGDPKLTTPNVRLPDPAEEMRIEDTVRGIFEARGDITEREQGWLEQLGQPSTVIFSAVKGEDFDKILLAEQHTQPDENGGLEFNGESTAVDLIMKPGQLRALGKTAAVDAFMGNNDRVTGLFNPQNWMVDQDTNTMSLVDNVGGFGGVFTPTSITEAYGEAVQDVSPRLSYDFWCAQTVTKRLADGAFDEQATESLDALRFAFSGKTEKSRLVRPEDRAHLLKLLDDHRPEMEAAFIEGITAGKASLMAALNNPKSLVAGVPPERWNTALGAVIARRYRLEGRTDEDAWAMGNLDAQGMKGPKRKKVKQQKGGKPKKTGSKSRSRSSEESSSEG